jgi:hypothetical protein
VTLQHAPETHTFFGTWFCVPDSHTFSRNRARSRGDGQKRLKASSEIQRFSGRFKSSVQIRRRQMEQESKKTDENGTNAVGRRVVAVERRRPRGVRRDRLTGAATRLVRPISVLNQLLESLSSILWSIHAKRFYDRSAFNWSYDQFAPYISAVRVRAHRLCRFCGSGKSCGHSQSKSRSNESRLRLNSIAGPRPEPLHDP